MEAALPPVLVDPSRVQRVLDNLIGNALRHTPEGGTVEIRARAEGDGVRVTVRDSGEGIPAADLPRVFEPTFSTTSSGAGLGLAIARRLVESWGGAISLDSEPGKGTRVTLTLQTAPPNPAG